MINNFERGMYSFFVKVFGVDKGVNIIMMIYKVYYWFKYYPRIYLLRLATLRRKLYLYFLRKTPND